MDRMDGAGKHATNAMVSEWCLNSGTREASRNPLGVWTESERASHSRDWLLKRDCKWLSCVLTDKTSHRLRIAHHAWSSHSDLVCIALGGHSILIPSWLWFHCSFEQQAYLLNTGSPSLWLAFQGGIFPVARTGSKGANEPNPGNVFVAFRLPQATLILVSPFSGGHEVPEMGAWKRR